MKMEFILLEQEPKEAATVFRHKPEPFPWKIFKAPEPLSHGIQEAFSRSSLKTAYTKKSSFCRKKIAVINRASRYAAHGRQRERGWQQWAQGRRIGQRLSDPWIAGRVLLGVFR